MVHKINDCPGQWKPRDLLQLCEERLLAHDKNCNIFQDHEMLKHQEIAPLPVTDLEFANGSNLDFNPETAEQSNTENWYQHLRQLTKNTTIHYVNAFYTFEAQSKDVHILENINVSCIKANGIFSNEERAAKPFADAGRFAQTSAAPIIPLLLDCKLNDSKPLQGHELKQVVEMLRDKNFAEVLQLLKRKRVIFSGLFDALMNLINEQMPSPNERCDEKGHQMDDEYTTDVFRYLNFSLLHSIEFVVTMYTEELSDNTDSIVSNNQLQGLSEINDFTINIQKSSNDTQQQKTDDPRETEDKQSLKNKIELLTVELLKIMEVVHGTRMTTPPPEEEASPPTASSDLSSLSQPESLSSLEWEDSSNDTLRQLLDIAMGRAPLPPDGSALFIIHVPIKSEMIKFDEGPEKSLPRSATSSLSGSDTNEDNGNNTLNLKKANKKYHTINNNINLEQIMIKELSSKKVYEQEKVL